MEIEHVTECPICGNHQFNFVLTGKDLLVSQQLFNILKCNQCSLLLTNPRPTLATIGNFYKSDDYISHSGQSKNAFDIAYHLARRFTLKWKSQLIKRKKRNGKLLDYGSGTGEFLLKMKSVGWSVAGVEPSEKAREKANKLFSNDDKPIVAELDQVGNGSFDAITLWHVLEHVHQLNEVLTHLNHKLNPEGFLFIAVPNYESSDAKIYQENWAAYDLPRHLWHFSRQTMNQLLTRNGFKIIEIVPMKLDAFYVNLLSEKYKHNGKLTLFTIFKAIRQAIQSNHQAKRAMNYSSLIYIAQHA